MSYDSLRLETKSPDSKTIALFAPSFSWEPSWTNDAATNPLPGGDNQAQIFDLSQWVGEIIIQGQFEDSQNLPPNHRNALDGIFPSGTPVSAQEQVDRAVEFLVFDPNPPYNLYINNRKYTANSKGEMNSDGGVSSGVYPNVSCSEIRTPEEAGLTRNEFLFRFNIGFVTGD